MGRASCMGWPAPHPASSEALTCRNGESQESLPAPVFQSPGPALPFFIHSHHCHCYNCQKLGVLEIGHSREEGKRQLRSTSAWRCENGLRGGCQSPGGPEALVLDGCCLVRAQGVTDDAYLLIQSCFFFLTQFSILASFLFSFLFCSLTFPPPGAWKLLLFLPCFPRHFSPLSPVPLTRVTS